MKPILVLRSSALPDIELQSITEAHLETLRRLKNAHRRRFFHQAEITPEAQRTWYDGYLQRADDWMFIVREAGVDRGCVGYRAFEGEHDIYNIIRDDSAEGRNDCFTHGLALLCAYLHGISERPVSGRVLADNPVVQWARRRGFRPTAVRERDGLPYVHLVHDAAAGPHHPVSVQTLQPAPPPPC